MAKQKHPVHLRCWCCGSGHLGFFVLVFGRGSERYPVSRADAAFIEARLRNKYTQAAHCGIVNEIMIPGNNYYTLRNCQHGSSDAQVWKLQSCESGYDVVIASGDKTCCRFRLSQMVLLVV